MYINYGLDDLDRKCLKYSYEDSSLWQIDPDINYIGVLLEDELFFLGSYNNYNTVSASKILYINSENVGVSQFILQFAVINE